MKLSSAVSQFWNAMYLARTTVTTILEQIAMSFTTVRLEVKGFGRNLKTSAIGRGTIRLQGSYNGRHSMILLENVLHIPAARSNLISGVLLGKSGIITTLGANAVTLSVNGTPVVGGRVINEMYRLDVKIIRPATQIPLADRISPSPLINRLTPYIATTSSAQNLDFCTA
ncbi:hypothetical protein BD410DRAFT_844467 [Rickenella mellea]|uniref:Retrovirus-related Pol polyprotein from transposon TNT 1-94-like beta-barrel domain-containing protein n=1 Tax=Rickenella mellea TaxID=50990 RepID=A0A4Y7PMH9_9AGAM|nr:hypothetical protein BD410DRAFT_844467 [Rickenella mellea]